MTYNALAGFDPAAEGWTERRSNAFMYSIATLWQRRSGGGISLGMICQPNHDNGAGRMHGGVIMTLADQALGAAAFESRRSKLAPGAASFSHVTIQLDVQFLAGIELGQFVSSDCRVTRETSSLSFVAGILQVAKTPVASATAIFKILRPKA